MTLSTIERNCFHSVADNLHVIIASGNSIVRRKRNTDVNFETNNTETSLLWGLRRNPESVSPEMQSF